MDSRPTYPALILTFGMLFWGNAFSQTPSQREVRPEAMSKTVVDMTKAELLQSYRAELSHVELNPGKDGDLIYLLEKAGDNVKAFFRDFSNTSSKEEVRLERYRPRPILDKTLWKEFYYLILLRSGKDGNYLVEDRTDRKNRPISQEAIPGFCMSSGYACLNLYLHPGHQAGSRFRYLGRETNKPRAYVLAFAQKPEVGDYLAEYSDVTLSTSTRFLVHGLIWLDPDTCQIARMRTGMLLPEKETVLREQVTDIYYMKVQFSDVQKEFWLPREVSVRWELPNQAFINRHRYSDYRLFAVESDYKIARPEVRK